MPKMSTAKKFLLYGLPPLLWMAFIFPVWNRALGSSRIYEIFADVFRWLAPHASAHALGVAYIVFRKTLHFIEYGFLAFLFYRAFRGGRGPFWSRTDGTPGRGGRDRLRFPRRVPSIVRPQALREPVRLGRGHGRHPDRLAVLAWTGSPRRRDPARRRRPGPVPQAAVRHRPRRASGFSCPRRSGSSSPLAVWLEDRGPVFYGQERVGRNGRIFKALKFRSMITDAETATGPVQAVANDPRVTRVGRLLRATAMDELPQLLNIFKGDMSFVGPRALRPNEKEVHGDPAPAPSRTSPATRRATPSGRD